MLYWFSSRRNDKHTHTVGRSVLRHLLEPKNPDKLVNGKKYRRRRVDWKSVVIIIIYYSKTRVNTGDKIDLRS